MSVAKANRGLHRPFARATDRLMLTDSARAFNTAARKERGTVLGKVTSVEPLVKVRLDLYSPKYIHHVNRFPSLAPGGRRGRWTGPTATFSGWCAPSAPSNSNSNNKETSAMEFTRSEALTYGLELELQIVNPQTGRLHPGCLDILDKLGTHRAREQFASEATLATIELNSSIQHHAHEMEAEIRALAGAARDAARSIGLDLRGGGTHLAQFWNERVMAPTDRARVLEQRYGFLPKRFSTYGMHVHVGMPDQESALRVANVLQALTPLFIAVSAASPFLQLSDTGFAGARPLEPMVYPHGGPMPFLRSWQELEDELEGLYASGIAQSLKDVYWDVRPKPEFGTVEVRVFDTPLRVEKAVRLAGLTRELACLALHGQLRLDAPASASAVRVSRFMACRDGLDARLYDPMRQVWLTAREWLAALIRQLEQAPPGHAGTRDLAGWRALLQDEPEHARIRASWAALQPASAQADAMQEALVHHSQAMCGLLLG